MATSYKARVLADTLAPDIAARLGVTVTKGLDTNSNPTLIFGTQSTGQQNAFIRIMPQASINTDILGLAQTVFTPHVIQLALETSGTATLSFLTAANMAKLMGALMLPGVRLEVYMRATGTLVSVSDITAANLLATIDGSLQYPLAGQ